MRSRGENRRRPSNGRAWTIAPCVKRNMPSTNFVPKASPLLPAPPYPPSGGNAARMKFPGDDEYKHAIPLLSLCHGILTNWSILSIPFLSKKKGSSGLAAQEQLALCDWSCHSHGPRISAKLDLKTSRSMNVPWRECSGVACSYPLAPGLWPSILANLKGACRAVFKWLLKIITRLKLVYAQRLS